MWEIENINESYTTKDFIFSLEEVEGYLYILMYDHKLIDFKLNWWDFYSEGEVEEGRRGPLGFNC